MQRMNEHRSQALKKKLITTPNQKKIGWHLKLKLKLKAVIWIVKPLETSVSFYIIADEGPRVGVGVAFSVYKMNERKVVNEEAST